MADSFNNSNKFSTGLNQWKELTNFASTAKYHSGARCIIKVNNEIAAFAFSVSWIIETQNIEIRTIDNYLPYELAPNIISINGTLSGFHIPGKGASASLIQSQVLDFLFHKYITIEVRDSTTDNLLLYVRKAVITSRQEVVSADNLTMVTLQWKGISWKDEIEPEIPTDIDPEKDKNEGLVATLQNSISNNIKKLF